MNAAAAGWMTALDEAARLLEAGESEAAACAMLRVSEYCPQMPAGALGPEAIATARRLLDRCRDAEARLRRKLTEEMASLGSSQRARAAYER